MASRPLSARAESYLQKLCVEITSRAVGRAGNRAATDWFAALIGSFGFITESPPFDCLDWTEAGADLTARDESFEVFVGPYSLGCAVSAPLAVIDTVEALAAADLGGQIALFQGDIAAEQLMPKNFPFYNPDEHRRIIHLLETKQPLAIVAATSQNPGLAGALYPFPLIEDGDFDIPNLYMKDTEGQRLAAYAGQPVSLLSRSTRTAATGCNVIARKGSSTHQRAVIMAHIDAKDGTPGAIDNGTGVTILLLLAELLADYSGRLGIEIVAMNGEDYYAAPGEIQYLDQNEGRLHQIVLGINADGVGYRAGRTAYSLYACPPEIEATIRPALSARPDMVEGQPWYQSDHSLFIQNGVPALAFTSDAFTALWTEIAHTANDVPAIVDVNKLVSTAQALNTLLRQLDTRLG